MTGVITTVAGTTTGFSGDGGLATLAQLAAPNEAFVDTAGNLYIADTNNNRIREVVASTGIINTIIGNATSGTTADGLTGPKTETSLPTGAWLNAQGDIIFSGNNYVRVLLASGPNAGKVYTVAGTNVAATTGDGGPALAATFKGPRVTTINSRGDYILTDKMFSEIRIMPALPYGSMTPLNIYDLAGTSGATNPGYTGDGGLATNATISGPLEAISDSFGNTFIADALNNVNRVVDKSTGNISTLAYLVSGVLSSASTISKPAWIAFAPNGTFAIADSGNHVVRYGTLANNFGSQAVGGTSAAITFTRLANIADTLNAPAFTPGGPADFTLALGGTCTGSAVAAGSTCNIPVTFTPTAPGLRVSQLITTEASTGLKSILPVTGIGTAPAVAITPGILTTFAGLSGSTTLTSPAGMAFDAAGNLYVSGADNTVRLISPSGTISTFAGTGASGNSGDGGAANAATLSGPTAIAIDPSGNLLIADTGNNAIREVSAEGGIINTISFSIQGAPIAANPAATTATTTLLNGPKGVATDSLGNVYIADTGNNVVRKLIRGSGNYTILAGTVGSAGYTGDGAAAASALLSSPSALAVDVNGNVFIADTGNKVVREISATTGNISTVAGNAKATSPGDGGLATSAELFAPSRIAVDAAGDLYIADAGSNSVRYVSAATGIITTIAGSGTATPIAGDGGLAPAATLNAPTGIALDAADDLYIADTGNQRIAKVTATTTSLNLGRSQQGTTSGVTTATITNFGNATLTLSKISFSAQFSQSLTTGNDCTPSTTLAPGASCLLGMVFSPTTTGTITGTATLTDNALNAPTATQTISLTGAGTSAPAAITVAGGNMQTTTPYGPYALSLTAEVVDNTNAPLSGSTVTFTAPTSGVTGAFANGSSTVQEVTNANGIATANLTAGGTRGTFNVTATVGGVSTPATFTETIAGNPSPVVTIAYSPATNPATYGTPITLIATLTPASRSGNTVSGTVTFYDAGTSIGTGTVSNGNGIATLTVSPTAGTHKYTASYGGDTNFSPATTATPAALTVSPLGITAAANSVSFVYGSPALPTITGTLIGVLSTDAANVTATYTGVVAAGSTTPIITTTPVGVYPILTTLSGSAAANYTVTATSGTVTITQAATTSVLTYSPRNAGAATSITLTDTVTPATGGVISGTVTFTDVGPSGTVVLGTNAKPGTGGTYTLAVTLALGTHVITASYGGSSNYTGSTAPAVTIVIVNPTLTLTQSAGSVSVAQGQTALMPFSYTATGGLLTTVNFTCSGVPANATCTINPLQFTPTGTLAGSTGLGLVSIQTAGPGLGFTAGLKRPTGLTGERQALYAALGSLPGLGLLLLSFRRNRKTRRKLCAQALLLILSAFTLLQTTGCGGNVAAPLVAQVTPIGTSTIVVTGTAGTVVASFTFTLTVTAAP